MAASVPIDQIKQALTEGGLFGSSLIPNTFSPVITVHATYPNPAVRDIQPGATYAVDATQDEPSVSFNAAPGPEAKYTLVLADPDAPSRSDQKWSPFRHWVLADVVPGQAPGQTLTGYLGPAPPEGTGPHRYVFLVYKQPVDRTPVLGVDAEERPKFDIGKFVRDNELELVGANFYYAENKK